MQMHFSQFWLFSNHDFLDITDKCINDIKRKMIIFIGNIRFKFFELALISDIQPLFECISKFH